MKAGEIKDICLNGSKCYYKYLADKPNGGVDEIDISKIEQINSDTFQVKITRKIFDPDAICFRHNGTELKNFTSEDIKIKVYDNDKRILILKVTPKAFEFISRQNAAEWKLIVDLKFLIQRVIDWYEQNGNQLVFKPGLISKNITFDKSVYISEKAKPSFEQENAIETLFKYNYSYIWGAPGTGKTKFVLSYALLNYIKKGKKTFILAPTNVALEQIFRGVIEMTDAAGIDRKQLLRLGFPSKSFASDFGEICEIQGVEKELKRINEQIKIISSILGIDSEEVGEIKLLIQELEKLKTLKRENLKTLKEYHQQEKKLKEIENFISDGHYRIKALSQEKKIVMRKKNSITGKIFGFLSKKVDYDTVLDGIIEKEKLISNKIKKLKNHHSEVRFKLSDLSKIMNRKTEEINTYERKIEEQFSSFEFHLNDDLDLAINELKEELKSKEEETEIFQSLSKEYENLSESELNKILEELQIERDRLSSYSIDERLQNVNVIGATLDTYLYRFIENAPKVDHIFIDEAGYVNIVKALTVFTSDTPITLLGDHKQLPPVSELSKSDIQKNEDYSDVFVWDQSAIYLEELWSNRNRSDVLSLYLSNSDPSYKQLIKSSLTRTYRFGPNLAKTLEQFVYDKDGFKSELNNKTEVIICKVSNPFNLRRKGRLNEAEAQCIKSYINKYYPDDQDIAILAPYRDQIKRLQELLPKLKDEDKILTVHKSQGREWSTVIFSVCDYGNGKKPWFTDSTSDISNGLNNLNTAVSRAKKSLVIFCSYDDWVSKQDQLLAGLLNSATKEISFDTSSLISEDQYSKHDEYKKTVYRPSNRKSSQIKGKNYVPKSADEQWESKTLFWSKKKLPGYKYSAKKDAWWKKKQI